MELNFHVNGAERKRLVASWILFKNAWWEEMQDSVWVCSCCWQVRV